MTINNSNQFDIESFLKLIFQLEILFFDFKPLTKENLVIICNELDKITNLVQSLEKN